METTILRGLFAWYVNPWRLYSPEISMRTNTITVSATMDLMEL